jgi:SAM-dependent methyltransferase
MPQKFHYKRLNLGCGSDYREGYVNVDSPRAVTRHDLSVDLRKRPWPWPDNSVDEILMRDSLEHLPDADENMLEIHRILKPGGLFHGCVPYAFSDGAVQALEHKSLFTEKSWDYLCGVSGYDAFGKPLFKDLNVKLFTVGNTPKTKLRNLLPLWWRLWRRHFVRNMFDGVEFSMIKV